MRAYLSLRRRGDFTRVTRRGRRTASTFLTCFVSEGRGRSRLGVTVSGAVGGSVVRNRLRRRIKAIFDGYPLGVPPWRDVVVIARAGAGELAFARLAEEVGRIFPPA